MTEDLYDRMITQPDSFALPEDFPAQDLRVLLLRVENELDRPFRSHNNNQPSTAWKEFAAAANGLRIRFRALAEADVAFRKILPRGRETTEDLYIEEVSLFAFFTSLVSAADGTAYMAYALASQLNQLHFRMDKDDHLTQVTLGSTYKRFKKYYDDRVITDCLGELLAPDTHYNESKDIRNRLSHRGQIPRVFNVKIDINKNSSHVIGGPHNTAQVTLKTSREIAFDANLTSERRAWLSEWLGRSIRSMMDLL